MRKFTCPLILIAFWLSVVIAQQVPGGGNRYGLPSRYGSGGSNSLGANSAGVNGNPNSRIFGLLGGGGGGGGLFGGLLGNLLGNRFRPQIPYPYPVYGGYPGFGGFPGFGGSPGFGSYPGFGGGFGG